MSLKFLPLNISSVEGGRPVRLYTLLTDKELLCVNIKQSYLESRFKSAVFGFKGDFYVFNSSTYMDKFYAYQYVDHKNNLVPQSKPYHQYGLRYLL